MNNKNCPLLSAAVDENSLVPCQGELCAWYVPAVSARCEGRCAVQVLGLSAPELVDRVRRL